MAGRLVGLGLCVLDHLYLVEGFDPESPRTRYVERREAVGGMTAAALVTAAGLGAEAHLLTALGEDAAGDRLVRALRSLGVRTTRIVRSPRVETTVAVVLVDRRSGERRFLVPRRRDLEERAPRFDLSPIRRGDVVLVDGHFPKQALRAVRRARRVGAATVADFHRPDRVARGLLPFVDFPIVPEEFARRFGDGALPAVLRQLARQGGGTPIVTQGPRGGVFLQGGRIRRYTAPRVRVRDTTGAGDAFHGAFAMGLVSGLPIEASLRLAAREAAACCARLGGPGLLDERGI